jgi:hypothetical protein
MPVYSQASCLIFLDAFKKLLGISRREYLSGRGARLAALPQWVEVMGWLDGRGNWAEEERGVMLSAVLDFVDGVERISP